MPNSVRDRLNCSWEYLFHLVRTRHYFYDLDAIRVPHQSPSRGLTARARRAKAKTGPSHTKPPRPIWAGPLAGRNDGLIRARAEGRAGHPLGKNPGDVWTLPTAPARHEHFAVFPEALVERPLRATCPVKVCTRCLAPTATDRSACDCRAPTRPGLVLDPFMGAGTSAVVAERLGRDWLGIELNPKFKRLALARIRTARRCGQQMTRGGDA
ncbi:MAG: DNA methyltransferase, partial [Solirubrobacteraceae bacterium]